MNLSLFNDTVSAAAVILRSTYGRMIAFGKRETIKEEAVAAYLNLLLGIAQLV
jgi:hypothetical protein